MKDNITFTITSLLAALLTTFHITDDIVRGFEAGGPSTYTAIVIVVVWLYATLVLAGRRSGYAIILVGSILASAVPYLHMQRAGLVGGRVANTGGRFFWVWTIFALGVTGMFSAILAARGLWNLYAKNSAGIDRG